MSPPTRRVAVEHVAHQAGAAGQVHELALEADQAARRNAIFEARAPAAVGFHVRELAAAHAERFHDRTLVRVLDVDRELLERLAALAVDVAQDDARPRHGQLVTFAPHVLEQDGQVQLAATEDGEDVGVGGVLDAQRDVGQKLRRSRSRRLRLVTYLPSLPASGEVLTWNCIDSVGSSTAIIGSASGASIAAIVVPMLQIVDAGDQHDVAGRRGFDRRALAGRRSRAPGRPSPRTAGGVAVEDHHFLSRGEAAAADAADAEASDVARIVERADLQLQRRRRDRPRAPARCARIVSNSGRMSVPVDLRVERRVAVQRRRVDDRKVELLFARAELVEQLEGLIDHPLGARARPVDLVDDHDRLQALRQRLARDEARLRHRAFDRVDQQQHAVDHRQHALDLAAEVGVAGRVDDVDVRIAVLDRAVLGDDGDAALALDVVAVHHPLGDVLMGGERPGLDQQLVDQRRLAVVDVGDDGDVAELARGVGSAHGATAGAWCGAGEKRTIVAKSTRLAGQKYLQNPVFRAYNAGIRRPFRSPPIPHGRSRSARWPQAALRPAYRFFAAWTGTRD